MSIIALDSIYRAPGPVRVKTLNKGFPAGVFRSLAELIGVSASALAEALDLSPRTIRTRTSRLSADEAERSFRVYRVYRRAEEVLGSPDAAQAWLRTPQLALGEQTPLSMLVRDVGADEVLNLLSAIEDGGYL